MGGQVEPRGGFKARAKKHFSNFIHSKLPKKELGDSKRSEESRGNLSNADPFNSVNTEKKHEGFSPARLLKKDSCEFTEFDSLKAWNLVDSRPPQSGGGAMEDEEPSSAWPEEFICPISKALMADPVIMESGITYERRSVQAYLQGGHRECFLTGEPLEHLMLTKNFGLKKAIDNWCDSRQVPRPVAPDAEAARRIVERLLVGGDDDICTRPSSAIINSDSNLRMSSDTASSSDSSGGGSRSRGITEQSLGALSAAAAHGMVKAPSSTNVLRPQQIPETIPVNGSAGDYNLSHSSEYDPTRERLRESRENYTWSGVDYPRVQLAQFPTNRVEVAAGSIEERNWSSATSTNKFIHSSSVINKASILSVTETHQGRAGGVPLPLTTMPAAFEGQNGGSGVLPAHVGDLNEAVLSGLIQKLQQRHPLEQEQAVVEIRRLTRASVQNRLDLCEPQFLEVLLPLVQSRYSNVQINAVAAILNLSLEKENKLKVARAGAIPPLIDVLKSGHFEAQEHAAGAIFSLALNDDNKMAIGVLGAIPPLIHVLRSGKHGARRDAAMALYHLSFSQMNRTKLIKAGGVGIFLGIARDERSDVVSRALLILCNIAAMQEGRVALSELSAVPVMVGLVTRGDEAGAKTGQERGEESKVIWAEVREHAAATLLQLSHHNFRFKSQAVQAGALEALQRLVEEGTPRAREKATALLAILRDSPGADSPLEDNGSLYRRYYVRNSRAGGIDEKAESAQF